MQISPNWEWLVFHSWALECQSVWTGLPGGWSLGSLLVSACTSSWAFEPKRLECYRGSKKERILATNLFKSRIECNIYSQYLNKRRFVALEFDNLLSLNIISNLTFLVYASHKEPRTGPEATSSWNDRVNDFLSIDTAMMRLHNYKRKDVFF